MHYHDGDPTSSLEKLTIEAVLFPQILDRFKSSSELFCSPQTWHKTDLSKVDSSLFKQRALLFSRERQQRKYVDEI